MIAEVTIREYKPADKPALMELLRLNTPRYFLPDEEKDLDYYLDDDRKVQITFNEAGDKTNITETFETESTNSVELQKSGWQAILDNFKKYTESLAG